VTGYTSSVEPHKSIAEVNADKKFTGVRDKVKDMHNNAESYAVLGSLCANLLRRDARVFRRALAMADENEYRSLIRRAKACTRPTKAAASAASKPSSPSAAEKSKVRPGVSFADAARKGVKATPPAHPAIPAKFNAPSSQPKALSPSEKSKVKPGVSFADAARKGAKVPTPPSAHPNAQKPVVAANPLTKAVPVAKPVSPKAIAKTPPSAKLATKPAPPAAKPASKAPAAARNAPRAAPASAAHPAGPTGGLLQSGTYIPGLSGGGWLISSIIQSQFSPTQPSAKADVKPSLKAAKPVAKPATKH